MALFLAVSVDDGAGDLKSQGVIPRLHLFELEDQPWFPGWLRNLMTDYLEYMGRLLRVEEGARIPLQNLLRRTEATQIVDLCSGAGGPWRYLAPALGTSLSVTLTDRYPHSGVQIPGIVYDPRVIDARALPEDLPGLRTIFTALHHFSEEDVIEIFRSSLNSGAGVFVCEVPHRSLKAVLSTSIVFFTAIGSSFFIRPFSLRRIILSTIVPIVPICAWFDGVVSCFRAYTPSELKALGRVADPTAEWCSEEVRIPLLPVPITLLSGIRSSGHRPARFERS